MPLLFASDVSQLNKSIKLILRKKPAKTFSGHSSPFNPKVVQRRFD
jgi:hypothetical protein